MRLGPFNPTCLLICPGVFVFLGCCDIDMLVLSFVSNMARIFASETPARPERMTFGHPWCLENLN